MTDPAIIEAAARALVGWQATAGAPAFCRYHWMTSQNHARAVTPLIPPPLLELHRWRAGGDVVWGPDRHRHSL
jgi:hypothetical protein